MRNRDIVIKGLMCCKGDGSPVRTCPPDCPYADVDEDAGFCNEQLMQDAIVLLKAEEQPTIGGWISVKDRLPDGNHVLARCEIHGLYKPKSYTCIAFYAKKYSISVGNCESEDFYDYDDETDEFYLREGWYEVIRNWDEYGSVVIGDFVTHWMPLPEPPEEVSGDA